MKAAHGHGDSLSGERTTPRLLAQRPDRGTRRPAAARSATRPEPYDRRQEEAEVLDRASAVIASLVSWSEAGSRGQGLELVIEGNKKKWR